MADQPRLSAFQRLPKIELHRHVEGAVRLETLLDIAIEYGIPLPAYSLEALRPLVQVMPNEPRTAQNFLGKFAVLRQFYRSPYIIQRVVEEAVQDAAQDNIRYMELRFTPAALSNVIRCSYAEVIEWVCAALQRAERQNNIIVRGIVSLNRHESPELGKQLLEATLAFRNHGIVALDLAGNEREYPAAPFYSLLEHAKEEGLNITVHAGEWAGAENVRQAVNRLGVDRIGHGVRAIEDPNLVDLLLQRGTVLEICPSSNVDSGVVASLAQHPISALNQRGVRTTLNTDDPMICNITLSDEFQRAYTSLAMSESDLHRHILTAAQATFLPLQEKTALVAQFQQDLLNLETPR